MTVSREQVAHFDFGHLPDSFYADPYPWYDALREHHPLHRCADGSWLLTRYRDCASMYRDPRAISDKREMFRPRFGDGPLFEHHTTSLVFNDPPLHTRVRSLLADALKPAAVRAMRPALLTLVDTLMDEAEKAGDRTVDLVSHYAAAIPLEMIGNLLTVPREERGPLRDWSLRILGALEVDLTPAARAVGDAAVIDFSVYLKDLVRRRRRTGSQGEWDILSVLIRSHDSGDLSEPELLHNCIFLLNAGHETTTNLIASGVLELLRRPSVLAQLRDTPDRIRTAVEEMLRYQSPNQLGNRQLRESMTLGSKTLPAGAHITLGIGAANRDPQRFEAPARFDILRHPNPHLAFATGIHSCIGMSLARLEAQVSISALLARFPALSLAGEPRWQRRARFRGLAALPVRLF